MQKADYSEFFLSEGMPEPVSNDSQRKAWCRDEDEQLRELVGRFGTTQWTLIASHLFGRNGKQCRER
jgi:hypothetical protein